MLQCSNVNRLSKEPRDLRRASRSHGRFAALHDSNQRHDAVMRKVGVAQEIASVIQDRASWQEHRLQVWFERGEILRLESCQEPIGAMVGLQSLGSGRVTRHHQRVGPVGIETNLSRNTAKVISLTNATPACKEHR
jgi:hypothetical protein